MVGDTTILDCNFLLNTTIKLPQADERSPVAPTDERIKAALDQVHSLYKDLKEGANADYIPELDKVDPELFGVTVATVDGNVFGVGDDKFEFSVAITEKVEKIIDDALAKKVDLEQHASKSTKC